MRNKILANIDSRDDYLDKVTVGKRKLHDAKILLVDYDPYWAVLFEREAKRIRKTLGDKVKQIQHVGSTSVPGLCAKPIIDILLIVADSSDEPVYVPELEAAGYTLRIREPDWFQHRLFNGPDTDIHLHVFSEGSPEAERLLRFRDWLRTHADDRQLYADAKRVLAQKTWKYMQDYADAKTEVVQEILKHALIDQ
ncbi:MAG: GrpB family protein [Chloroflexi bacterium]|nr:GrpB family protein [Chloroflexota bacterium]